MKNVDYISGLSFRFLQPQTPVPIPKILKRFERFGIWLDRINTRLSSHERARKRRLDPICGIPKMSTFAIGALINQAVSQLADDEVFVNVGVWHGFSFFSGLLENPKKRCIGVDNFSGFGGPREFFLEKFNRWKSPLHRFYEMDYVDYFS